MADLQNADFTRGVAYTIATMYKMHDNGVACADMIRAAGLTLAECRAAKVDENDMKILRKLFRMEPSLAKSRDHAYPPQSGEAR